MVLVDNGSSGGYGCRRGCCDLGGISDGGYERGHGGGGGTGYSGHCCGDDAMVVVVFMSMVVVSVL